MMSKSVQVLVPLAVMVVVALGGAVDVISPAVLPGLAVDQGDLFNALGDRSDLLGWLGDDQDDLYVNNYYRADEFNLFFNIIRSVRLREDNFASWNTLFRRYLLVNVERRSRLQGGIRLYDNYDQAWDSTDLTGLLDRCFDEDYFQYSYVGDRLEERNKQVYMYFLKFQAHWRAQLDIEGSRYGLEERARRQFALYTELITFGDRVRSQRVIAQRFSSLVDTRLQTNYATFRSCFFAGTCQRFDDSVFQLYRTGEYRQYFSLDGGDQYLNDGRHFELFLRLFRYSLPGSSREGLDDFPYWDNSQAEVLSTDLPYRNTLYLDSLYNYVYTQYGRDFWGRKFSTEEDNERFLFFALRAYRELRVERSLWSRRERLSNILGRFFGFINYQESSERINGDFSRFRQWHAVGENRVRLNQFVQNLRRDLSFQGKYVSPLRDRLQRVLEVETSQVQVVRNDNSNYWPFRDYRYGSRYNRFG